MNTRRSKKQNSLQRVSMIFEQCPALKGQPPTPRGGHSATVIGSKIWIFGGCNEVCLNDLYLFDTENNTWKEVHGHGKKPAPRWGHSCTAIGQKLYIFGGYDGSFMNDLYIFDTETLKWRQSVTKGPTPAPRRGHTAIALDNTLYVIGGIGDRTQRSSSDFSLSTLYALDTVTMKWETVKTRGLSETKMSQFHASAVIGPTVWFFGGTNGLDAPETHYYALNLQTKTWEVFDNLPVGVYSQSCIALPITTVKSMEYALTGLNCLRVHTRAKEEIRVVMFGGFDGVSNRNDVYLFDPEHKTWKKSAIRGRNIPAPRSDHTASLVDNKIYIFGGYGGSKLYFNDMFLLVDSHEEMHALKEGMKQLTLQYKTLQRKMERMQRKVMLLNGQIEFDFSELSSHDLRVLKEYHSNILREIKKFEEKKKRSSSDKSTKKKQNECAQTTNHPHPHKHKNTHSQSQHQTKPNNQNDNNSKNMNKKTTEVTTG